MVPGCSREHAKPGKAEVFVCTEHWALADQRDRQDFWVLHKRAERTRKIDDCLAAERAWHRAKDQVMARAPFYEPTGVLVGPTRRNP